MKLAALPMIVRRSLRQHALSTSITVLSAALACGLVMGVFSLSRQTREAFVGGEVGFDAVLGARGSALQLVLNTVFHLETSPGNIPWSLYEEVRADRGVELALPYAVGDNYRGYRVVGTTTELFGDFELQRGKRLAFHAGRAFEPAFREAVVGSYAAQELGLRPGSTFQPYHGVTFQEGAQHAEVYTVVGVLEPTNSPTDRVLFIPIDGVFRMGGHILRGSGEAYTASEATIPDEHKELSAVMLRLRNPQAGFRLNQLVNQQGSVATLAFPIGASLGELFDKLGWVNRVLELVAYLVVVVAAGSILASLYNTMNERRREFAILRALGASRGTVFAAIVSEAATIALLGGLLGYGVYAALLLGAGSVLQQQTGVVLDPWSFHPALLWTPALMFALGALAGLLPAFKAYGTDVASTLVPSS